MSHLPIMPVLVPMFVGALLLVLRGSLDMKRALALLATLATSLARLGGFWDSSEF